MGATGEGVAGAIISLRHRVFYYVDECVYAGSSLSVPTRIYSTVWGEYDHRVPLIHSGTRPSQRRSRGDIK